MRNTRSQLPGGFRTLTILVALLGWALLPVPAAEYITTGVLNLDGPVDHLALSDDGALLFAAQQQKDRYHMIDTASGRILKTISTPAPSFILVRGIKAYVLNRGAGTISVYRIDAGDCLQVDQLLAGSKTVNYLSAPQGLSFSGAFLATGPHDTKTAVYLVREGNDRPVLLRDENSINAAIWSADGSYVIEQHYSSLQAKPVRSYLDLRPEPEREDIMNMTPSQIEARNQRFRERSDWARSEIRDSALVNSYADNDVWYSSRAVLAGRPPAVIPTENVQMVIADQTAGQLYLLSENRLQAVKADSGLQTIGSCSTLLGRELIPAGAAAKDNRFRRLESQSGVCSPVAATVGGKSFIYAPRAQEGLLRVEMVPLSDRARMIADRTSSESIQLAGADNFPSAIQEGERVKFPLYLDSVRGIFDIIEAPTGVDVSTTGLLTWTPTHDQRGEQQIKIRANVGGSATFIRLETEVVDRKLVQSFQAVLEGTPGLHIVNGSNCSLVPNSNKESVLLLDGNVLKLLDANGKTVLSKLQLDGSYSRIAERGSGYIALGPHNVDLLDRNTGKRICSISLPSGVPTDLAIDPVQAFSYVAMKAADSVSSPTASSYFVVRVNEQERTSSRINGPVTAERLSMASNGRTLFATVPGLDSSLAARVPSASNAKVDSAAILRFSLSGSDPELQQCVGNQGSPITALRLSPDGGLVSAVASSGNPAHEGYEIAGLSAADLNSERISFAVGPYPQDIAYHDKLPFVAATNGERILVFNRLTGRPLTDVLDLHSIPTLKIHQLMFTPGGKHLLVHGVTPPPSKSLVVAVPLRLSEREIAQLDIQGDSSSHIQFSSTSGPAISTADSHSGIEFSEAKPRSTPIISAAVPEKRSVNPDARRSVDGDSNAGAIELSFDAGSAVAVDDASLRATLETPSPGPLRDAESLARQFSDSVVTIESGGSSGTGFFITANGYILTCSHVLPDEALITVRYQSAGSAAINRVNATIVQRSRDEDLALLKIQPSGTITPVRLNTSVVPSMGEIVYVIGNPGVGSTILEHTMTQGIVSHQNRSIDGHSYIQTSAAVNPGSSGSPAFNKYGQAIGVVVAKASVAEGVGFVVPPNRVAQFLRSCLKTRTRG